jgi:hypothetical protein
MNHLITLLVDCLCRQLDTRTRITSYFLPGNNHTQPQQWIIWDSQELTLQSTVELGPYKYWPDTLHCMIYKGKEIPVQSWTGPKGSRNWGSQILRPSADEGQTHRSTKNKKPTRCTIVLKSLKLYCILILLYMFRALLRPSSGAS